jgi:hypothetical protein
MLFRMESHAQLVMRQRLRQASCREENERKSEQ